jgi:tRNA A37 threonylcarbamoyladenosine synthetase subunit TsaC/SUA5/YrdC
MFGTSANIAGQAAIYESEKIIEQFGNLEQLSFIDAGDLKESPPSTIVDLTQSPPKILR